MNEILKELCIKMKLSHFRKDIVVLQDPQNVAKFNLNKFHHVKNALKINDDGN